MATAIVATEEVKPLGEINRFFFVGVPRHGTPTYIFLDCAKGFEDGRTAFDFRPRCTTSHGRLRPILIPAIEYVVGVAGRTDKLLVLLAPFLK